VGGKENSMKDGKCPKCSSTEACTKPKGIGFGQGSVYVHISSEWASKPIKDVDSHLCANCGYFENYISDKAKLEAVAKDWTKVG
jgi:predicted nucleic-acid-binding Zn-ribbon protein